MKHNKFVIHTFMLFTLLAYIAFLFLSGRIARVLFTIGGSSCYIALGLGSAAEVSTSVSIICLLWLVLFPLALLISYILTFKKHYLPFCIIAVLDFGVVFAFALYSFCTRDTYGFQIILPDLIVSLIVLIFIIRTTYLLRLK